LIDQQQLREIMGITFVRARLIIIVTRHGDRCARLYNRLMFLISWSHSWQVYDCNVHR